MHRHDARISREICEAARQLRLPVLYDPMGEVAVAELLATEFPDVNFIIPHLGSFADDWSAQLAFTESARRPAQHLHRHLRRPPLRPAGAGGRRAGPHKVLFGSDGPWLHPGVELAKIELLDLPPRARSLVVAGNFLRLTRARRGSSAPRPSDADDDRSARSEASNPFAINGVRTTRGRQPPERNAATP